MCLMCIHQLHINVSIHAEDERMIGDCRWRGSEDEDEKNCVKKLGFDLYKYRTICCGSVL